VPQPSVRQLDSGRLLHSFAAFFSQIGRKNAGIRERMSTTAERSAPGRRPHDGWKFLGGSVPDVKARTAARSAEVDRLRTYFARNLNIVWACFFGSGIIDPVDDVRVSNRRRL
jgi:hypothetical protein